jgi:hypothetical protein
MLRSYGIVCHTAKSHMSSVTLSGHLGIAWSNILITISFILPRVTEGVAV